MVKGDGERYTRAHGEPGHACKNKTGKKLGRRLGTTGKKGHFQAERLEEVRAEMGREGEEGHGGGGSHCISTSSHPCRKWDGELGPARAEGGLRLLKRLFHAIVM